MITKIHPLPTGIQGPERFTYPFNYEPHPLCRLAAAEVQRYVGSRDDWREELQQGKMFGVLVVDGGDGKHGFLAAYSGLLGGRNDWQYFVPPVVDSQQPDGYFKTHEREITAVNREIEHLQASPLYKAQRDHVAALLSDGERQIDEYRKIMAAAKARRQAEREGETPLDNGREAERIRESQYQKAELRRLKKRLTERLAEERATLESYEKEIQMLRHRRKQLSDSLQHWLFSQYSMLNARGERRDLLSIFAATPQRVPPSGAGDCCAPKLLQYAYEHGLRPVCMAEFWWGQSPKSEVRHHLHYYPACHSKCKPILGHMLQGLSVDPDPHNAASGGDTLRILYEDDSMAVVSKPPGMLSVPGNVARQSVVDIIRRDRPECSFIVPAHRLDMDTSGLLVVAKTPGVLRSLHEQFAARRVVKVYRAILAGRPDAASAGNISLPLAADPTDRPRQRVDREKGKPAETHYEIVEYHGNMTEILLYPHTGRTHQLRIHCAHRDGLATPILGDPLYGHTSAPRMYLHAERIIFFHPSNGEKMELRDEPDWDFRWLNK